MEKKNGRLVQLARNWHIATMAVGLVISLLLHWFPQHEHDIEFGEEIFAAVSTVVADQAPPEATEAP